MNEKTLKKLIIGAIALFVVLVVAINSCSQVGPTEKGIVVTLGKPSEVVLESGLHFKAPFVQKIQKYDVTPIQYKKSLGIGTDGALTADKQTIGVDYELFWKYDAQNLYTAATSYRTKESIYERISTPLKEIIKDEIAKRDVTSVVNEISAISKSAEQRLVARLAEASNPLPVKIEGLSIVNIDWSDDYDKQLKETANRTQQVKIAQQEAEIAGAQAQKLIKESEAKKAAAELDAEATRLKAQGEADAKKIAADAVAYENQKIAQNLSTMQATWKHEEEMARLNRWDGVQVSSQSIYVPNTYDLKSGK